MHIFIYYHQYLLFCVLEPSSLNNSLGYDRNRGLGLNSKSLSGKYYRPQPNMDSDDLNNKQIQNSRSTRLLNNKPLQGLYYRNKEIDRQNSMTSEDLNSQPSNGLYNIKKQNNKTLKDQNITNRQNSKTSDFRDYPNLTKTKINPSVWRIARQKSLAPSSYEDVSQQISVGNDNTNMMNIMNSIKQPLNGQNIIFKSFRKCCINGECRMLQDEEECKIDDYFVSNLN